MSRLKSALLPLLLASTFAALPGCKSSRDATSSPTPPSTQPASLDDALALLDKPRPNWDERTPLNLVRHPNEKLIKGWIIVLDPGHGGDAKIPGFKKGPTGAREAIMNYNTAVLLQKLLTEAGATVILTRDGDYDLTLSERAWYANNIPRPDGTKGADFFISIHHNAADAPTANYTSVWYHGPVDRASVDLDIARTVLLQLTSALRTTVPPRQTLFSDRQMYASGFGVLAASTVPSFLIECSFYTHPAEEQRLRDGIYNLRAAYAIYLGICDYARGGRPTQLTPLISRAPSGRVELTTTLDDGLNGGWGAELGRILESTIDVRINGVSVPHEFDPKSRRLSVDLTNLSSSDPTPNATLELRFANHWKNHNYPQRYALSAAPAPTTQPLIATPLGIARDPRPASTPATNRSTTQKEPGADATTRPTPRPLPW